MIPIPLWIMAFTTTKPITASEKSRHIIRLLEEHGQDDYIGEDISQLEHCLQAADQAKRAHSRDDVRHILQTRFLLCSAMNIGPISHLITSLHIDEKILRLNSRLGHNRRTAS